MKLPFACVAGALGASCASAAFAASTVAEGLVKMPTYPFSDPDPVPCTAERRYPYFRFDGSVAASTTQSWTCVTLENECVRARRLPQGTRARRTPRSCAAPSILKTLGAGSRTRATSDVAA